MTDEKKNKEEQKECKCLCQNKYFKKFIVVSAGTFVGAFLALSLFAALNKPPMPAPMPMPCPCQQMLRPDFGPQHFDRRPRGDFHKKFDKEHAKKKFPPKTEQPEIDD